MILVPFPSHRKVYIGANGVLKREVKCGSAYLLRRQKKRSVRMLPTIRLGKYLFERNGSILTLPQYTMTLSQAQKDPDLPTLIKLLPRVQANDKGSEHHISVTELDHSSEVKSAVIHALAGASSLCNLARQNVVYKLSKAPEQKNQIRCTKSKLQVFFKFKWPQFYLSYRLGAKNTK